ncbi:MAG: hypothetical protein WCX79_04460 [Candidatus Paceibacterota bacterium]|jgi:mRNA-degrading endonuclease RelE of RelBE toxin-antitoxin system
MNKNEKLLRRISLEDRKRIKIAISLIERGRFMTLDVKKLSGAENEYRARIGKFRIKFLVHENYYEVIEIIRRSDHTY